MSTSTARANHDSWGEQVSWGEQHAALQRLLRAHQEVLRLERRSLREMPPCETTVGADEEERAAQELEVGLDIALIEMHSRQVREIELALELLEAGNYGRCVDCDQPILASRLQARPFAVRCGSCQKAFEEDDHAPRGTARLMPSSSDWGLLDTLPWPRSRRGPTTPKARRRHEATAVPMSRPLSFGGVSLRAGAAHRFGRVTGR